MKKTQLLILFFISASGCSGDTSIMHFDNDSYLYLNPEGDIWVKGKSNNKVDPYNPPIDAEKYRSESLECLLSRSQFSYMTSKIGSSIQTPERPIWTSRVRQKDDVYVIGFQKDQPIIKKNSDYFFLNEDLDIWAKSIQKKCFQELNYESLPQLS